MPTFTLNQVKAHNNASDVWIIIHSKVYDLTSFLDDHPGGKKVLLKVAGTDASKQFDNFHNESVLKKFGPKYYVGDLLASKL
jgi:cytochrome b involved in lipid metabolism